jgi:DNA-binding response OmpR family regulator
MKSSSIVSSMKTPLKQISNNNNTIVVADDDPAILDAMKMILEFYNFDVVTISDGRIIPLLEILKPKLLFLDICMSGVDGKDICKELKENEAIKDIPVVMISASCELVKVVKEAGADDYLPKPFEVTDLLSKVNKYLLN